MLHQTDYKIFSNCQMCDDESCAVQILSIPELRQLCQNCNEASFEKGEIILSGRSTTSHIVYLREGLVKEYGKTGCQKEYILQVIKPHSYLGLYSIFSNTGNHYSYTALTPVRVCLIQRSIFSQFIRENGRFGYEILSSMCNDSLNNYHRFIDQCQKKIFGKVADALLYFSQVIFESGEFQLPLSRKEIASMIGTSRESVSKQISDFEREKIIELRGRNVKIIDMEKLRHISCAG